MTELSTHYHWRITHPDPPQGWREHLAHWLRNRADQLDQRSTILIDSHTSPPLPSADIARCYQLGGEHAKRLLDELLRHEAAEQLLAKTHPELYIDWGDTPRSTQ